MLPNPLSGISPHVLGFLDERFKTHEDLSKAPSLSKELKKQCGEIDRNLTTLQKNLFTLIAEWISQSSSLKTTFLELNLKLLDLGPHSSQDGKEERKIRKILGDELPKLAGEVRRIETVRAYAETTLRLEAFVGDLEDAVFCVLNQNARSIFPLNIAKDFQWKQEKLLLAVQTINNIEEVVACIVKSQSQWFRLLNSVDARVDKSLAVLRLQALADHRALLASLGWPPPLTSEPERDRGSDLPNPLVVMQRDKREKYSQSFLALCALQHLQTRREERQLNLVGNKDHRLGLWAIDELVSPIASKAEHHFSRWFDQPKFIFALVYKITRGFAPGVDDVLQPMIDEARLVGYSAKEAWVSAMVKMLSTFLTKRMFSVLAERYQDKNGKLEVCYSWLHLIDLIIAFDKQMQSLASLGTTHFVEESLESGGTLRDLSVLSVFCDQPEWLRLWAKIELKDALGKLKVELENGRAWKISSKTKLETRESESFILSGREDHKAPVIAEAVVKITQAMIDRCQTLPVTLLQVEFIRLSAARFLWNFFNTMLQRCKEREFVAGYAEDDAMKQVCASINAARYCESILREWSEEVNFLEMRIAECDSNAWVRKDQDDNCYFFWEEVKFLMKFETDWLAEIMTDLLRQFDTLSWEYVQNKEQWGWDLEDSISDVALGVRDFAVSSEFVEALDTLRDRLHVLESYLNSRDFLDLWRSIADGLDHFIFGSIIMNAASFSKQGVTQFLIDMRALFLVFHPFCARPEAFFPCIRDSLKLLGMDFEDVQHLQSVLCHDGKRVEQLRLHGIVYVSPDQAEKILKTRKFGVDQMKKTAGMFLFLPNC